MAEIEFTPHVSLRATSTELVMLFDQAEGIMYELNDTASQIAKLLVERGPCSEKQILDILTGLYAIDAESISTDLAALLADFEKLGLVSMAG